MKKKNTIIKTLPLLHELFFKQAKKKPSAVAVKSPSKQLSYQELALLSKALAKKLIQHHTKPSQLIAIVIEKGWEQIVATLGTLLSGSAYLPIDPSESKDRLNYLLNISHADIVLTQAKFVNQFDGSNKTIIAMDALALDGSFEDDTDWLKPGDQNNLAYEYFFNKFFI